MEILAPIIRPCSRCGSTGNPFPKIGRMCKLCIKKYKAEHYQEHKVEINQNNLNNYYKNKGTYSAAKAAYYRKNAERIKARVRAYAAQNPERILETQLRNAYGITLMQFHEMELGQQGLCKICGKPPSKKRSRLSVDHDHVTGKIRGLLCVTCNYLLGAAYEDTTILKEAIAYLERNRE
jgi:hypothetical protein